MRAHTHTHTFLPHTQHLTLLGAFNAQSHVAADQPPPADSGKLPRCSDAAQLSPTSDNDKLLSLQVGCSLLVC